MWLWSKLSSSQWADAWEERFYGNTNAVITELKGGKSLRVEVYCATRQEAEGIRAQFGGGVKKLSQRDLTPPPPEIPPPVKIRDCLVITQERDDRKWGELRRAFPGRQVLRIPAEMAFGTGDHPTTATCLRLLVDRTRSWEQGTWRMLDLGCGSGVLAIAARLLGAAGCLAMDYDASAVVVTQRNVTRNELDGIEIKEGDVLSWTPQGRYEFVAANLFAGVLQEAMPMIARSIAQGGSLVLSGILQPQWSETRRTAEEVGFDVLEVRPRGKWMTALLQSRM